MFGRNRREKGEGNKEFDEYFDEFESFQKSLRKRNKTKEIDKFRTTFAKDSWSQNINRPISNATFMSDQKAKSLFGSSKVYVNSSESIRD